MMTQIDLAKVHVERLDFSATHAINEDIITELRSAQAKKTRTSPSLVFGETYSRSNVEHHCIAELQPARQPEKGFDLVFHYSSLRGGLPVKSRPKVSYLIEKLASLEDGIKFHCLARFRYGQEDIGHSAIPLPIRLPFEGALPFNGIWGIKFVKTSDSGFEQTVIVDLLEDGRLFHSVHFDYISTYSLDLPENILQKAIEISSQYFRKR